LARCKGWCGICYEGLRGRSFSPGHAGYRKIEPRKVDAVGSVLRKRISAGGDGKPVGGLGVCSVLDPLPGLREMLSESHFPDGATRLTATLLMFVEDGVVKVCLNDRDQGCAAWASGASLCDCLEALEAGLQGDSLQWRASGARKGGNKQKRS
jgi:hypothetical protein